jgi:NhaP-type Na+/H+ or K+/H+ antiporter
VVLGTVFGIVMGPHCANIFNPRSWITEDNDLTLELTRIVLAVGLFTIGVELPGAYMWEHARGLLALVVPTMTIGWFAVAGFIKLLFSDLNYVSCLLIAACLTPTDPVISAAIVNGTWAEKHVPRNLRLILAAESAANDGLAYPFLSIAFYLTVDATTRQAFGDWFLNGWLCKSFSLID